MKNKTILESIVNVKLNWQRSAKAIDSVVYSTKFFWSSVNELAYVLRPHSLGNTSIKSWRNVIRSLLVGNSSRGAPLSKKAASVVLDKYLMLPPCLYVPSLSRLMVLTKASSCISLSNDQIDAASGSNLSLLFFLIYSMF